jgi:hypothetical protein
VLGFYFTTFAFISRTFMASRDPYAAEQYGRPGQYADVPDYNPYGGNRQPHQTYDQEGYEPYETATYRDEPQMQSPEHPTFPPVTHNKETNEFLNGSGEK